MGDPLFAVVLSTARASLRLAGRRFDSDEEADKIEKLPCGEAERPKAGASDP
tara:strand:- start:495 stop:650 length:156 start_codon:yes stop_codon:yes gene_type:complete